MENETHGMTGVPCVCGMTHRFTPSAMAVLLLIGESGDLHYVVGEGEIHYHCLFNAISTLPPTDPRLSFYRGSVRFNIGKTTSDPRVVYTKINGRRIAESESSDVPAPSIKPNNNAAA